MTDTERVYTLPWLPGRLTSEQLQAIASEFVGPAIRLKKGGSTVMVYAFIVHTAQNELDRRRANRGADTPIELTAPLLPLAAWSDAEIADALAQAVPLVESNFPPEVRKFLKHVRDLVIREAGARLKLSNKSNLTEHAPCRPSPR